MPAAVAGQPATPKLSFSPDNVMAAPGDTVRFNFMQKNHSVAQSTFDTPCEVMAGGAQSGFMPNPEGTLPPPTFDFQVKDTKPVWMYCQQTNHCGQGMVFAINPANGTGQATDKSMANYKQIAISKFGTELSPAALAASGDVQQAAAGQTITVNVSGAGASAAAATATAAAAAASGSVASGSGTGADGQTCACQCLCGVNAFPAAAGMGQFGGFLGKYSCSTFWQCLLTSLQGRCLLRLLRDLRLQLLRQLRQLLCLQLPAWLLHLA